MTAREQAAGLPARQREELAHDGHGELGRQLHTIAERQGLATAELPRLDALLRHCQRRGAAHAGVDYELAVRQSGVESKAKSPVCPHSIVSDRGVAKENSGREFQRTLFAGALRRTIKDGAPLEAGARFELFDWLRSAVSLGRRPADGFVVTRSSRSSNSTTLS